MGPPSSAAAPAPGSATIGLLSAGMGSMLIVRIELLTWASTTGVAQPADKPTTSAANSNLSKFMIPPLRGILAIEFLLAQVARQAAIAFLQQDLVLQRGRQQLLFQLPRGLVALVVAHEPDRLFELGDFGTARVVCVQGRVCRQGLGEHRGGQDDARLLHRDSCKEPEG